MCIHLNSSQPLSVSESSIFMAGIDVGHQFFSRAEMVAAGFHNHWLNGIDYVGKNGSKVSFL